MKHTFVSLFYIELGQSCMENDTNPFDSNVHAPNAWGNEEVKSCWDLGKPYFHKKLEAIKMLSAVQ